MIYYEWNLSITVTTNRCCGGNILFWGSIDFSRDSLISNFEDVELSFLHTSNKGTRRDWLNC